MITKVVIVSAPRGFASLLALSLLAEAALMTTSAHAQDCSFAQARISQLEAQIQELLGELGRVPPAPSEVAPSPRIAFRANGQANFFVRDTSIAALNEAWRDPSGMIWGDIVRNEDRSIHFMDQYQASTYCESIGATLPSREDFVRLREYMGARSGTYEGYTPQVLPNFTRNDGGETYGNSFWSSSVHPDDSNGAYAFGGRYGAIGLYYRYYDYDGAVRCVARR